MGHFICAKSLFNQKLKDRWSSTRRVLKNKENTNSSRIWRKPEHFSYFLEDEVSGHSFHTIQRGIWKVNQHWSKNHNSPTSHQNEASNVFLLPWLWCKHKCMKDVLDRLLPVSCPFQIHTLNYFPYQETGFPIKRKNNVLFVSCPEKNAAQSVQHRKRCWR